MMKVRGWLKGGTANLKLGKNQIAPKEKNSIQTCRFGLLDYTNRAHGIEQV